jgi:diaminohydroxyphosphoribosylaminopyrimidine deaminase/5-amino-6-(5-phosphoribosylamino)uracil reductase
VKRPLPTDDEEWMQRALSLARRGEGRTRPNPPVGAVVVKSGRIVGEGYHHRAGMAHAEVEALKGLSRRVSQGATMFVTLEPCCTHGKTPPCTGRILDAGISRVVVGVRDPNPRHCGRGLRKLRSAGVDVDVGVCRAEAKALLAPFAKWVTTALPYVTLKMGMTLDGRIADSKGVSRWITGPAARREVRRLRQRSDAILVGSETAVVDDPSLRWSENPARNPLRIIIDSKGAVSPLSKVFTDGHASNTIVASTSRCPASRSAAYRASGAEVLRCGRGKRVDLRRLLHELGERGVLHVLCEGGGVLAEELVRLGVVDRFEFFVAPKFLGGGGCPVLGGGGWGLEDGPQLRFLESRQVGRDVWVSAEPL